MAVHAGAWPGCKAFTNQPTAQATWEAAGKPPNADRDGDGKVCESLPATAPAAPAAQTPSSPDATLAPAAPAPAPGTVTSRVSPLRDRRGLHPGLTAVPRSQRARARRLIRLVRTAPAGSRAGYSRDAFGTAWTDATTITWGQDGCKTREQILRRDLRRTTYRAGTSNCVVLTGILRDPYTATTIRFAKSRALEVQIDHVMPLAYAGGGWVVIDAGGEDRRQIEALSAAMDGRDLALAIATDYAEQAQVARRPLVCTPQPADDRERQAVAA